MRSINLSQWKVSFARQIVHRLNRFNEYVQFSTRHSHQSGFGWKYFARVDKRQRKIHIRGWRATKKAAVPHAVHSRHGSHSNEMQRDEFEGEDSEHVTLPYLRRKLSSALMNGKLFNKIWISTMRYGTGCGKAGEGRVRPGESSQRKKSFLPELKNGNKRRRGEEQETGKKEKRKNNSEKVFLFKMTLILKHFIVVNFYEAWETEGKLR